MYLWLVAREPRTLVLSPSDDEGYAGGGIDTRQQDAFCLVLRKPPPETTSGVSVVVEFLPRDEIDMDGAVLLLSRPVYGCLGVLRLGEDTFVAIVTSSTSLGSNAREFTGPGTESISRILAVDFFCLTSALYDTYNTLSTLSTADDAATPFDDIRGGAEYEHPCAGIRKILGNSSFYYSAGVGAFDLSTRLETRVQRAQRPPSPSSDPTGTEADPTWQSYNPLFLWNTFLIHPLLTFRASLPTPIRTILDRSGFLVLAIQGSCGVFDVRLGGEPAVLSLISRLGWKRAGTRFNTETILRTPTTCFAFTQIRGSVPLFWEETGVQPFGLKITITRPIEASLPAFLRHFDSLLESYSSVHVVNLLSSKDQEANLTASYEAHISAASEGDEVFKKGCSSTLFDFHAKSKMTGGIEGVRRLLDSALSGKQEEQGASLITVDADGKATLVIGQRGVFRTNCKDCLDRTNVVQDMLSRFAIEEFIRNSNPAWSSSDSLWGSHRILFAENGDALSKIYVGTGAINTSFTRSGKKSFAGILSDATKSVGRMYQSNFIDGGKQRAIDALLGQLNNSQTIQIFDPINDALHASMDVRASEYTSYEPTTIWVGTYNLNGKGPGSESLLPWLFPKSDIEPAILVVSFQEIVPLTPSMIMATDPETKRRWEARLLKTLVDRPDKKDDYIILRSGQLVGTALIVLIKKSLANDVRNVEAATKKTGLKGMAGNKGAVAIRLDFRDTSLCFVTAHLAAGHSNLDERNSDYFTIEEGLHFSKGKAIRDHENVLWAADTNYRISLPNDEVRSLALQDDYAALAEGDQLLASMKTRGVFAGFTEGPLLFRPTYKYDNGTGNYDSSEKQRIPAWTDRILYKGDALDLTNYQCAELLTSDHRPVYGIFQAKIRSIDRTKREDVRKQILQDILAHSPHEKLDHKLAKMVEASQGHEGDLPPPSDDKHAWWNGPDPLKESSGTRNSAVTNPFEDDYFLASAPPLIPKKPNTISAVRRKPPPVPSSSIAASSPDLEKPGRETLDVPGSKKIAPPLPSRPSSGIKRSTSATSLLDSDEGIDLANQTPGSWQVIEAK